MGMGPCANVERAMKEKRLGRRHGGTHGSICEMMCDTDKARGSGGEIAYRRTAAVARAVTETGKMLSDTPRRYSFRLWGTDRPTACPAHQALGGGETGGRAQAGRSASSNAFVFQSIGVFIRHSVSVSTKQRGPRSDPLPLPSPERLLGACDRLQDLR